MVVLGKRISDRVGGLGSRRVNRRGQELFPIKTHFNLSPAQYEALRTGHMYRRRRELVEETLRVRGDEVGSVLEVGSGTGALLAELASRFPAMQFLGVDVDPRMISHAQERHQLPNLRFALSDITSDGSRRRCEFVYSIDVIHHIHQPLYFFRAVRQMLRRGGVWLVMEPNIFHPYILWQQERMHRAGFDEDHFRPWLLEPLMRQAGFAIESRRFRFLFPGWIQSLPAPLGRLERAVEGSRFLGASILYSLVAE